jgi:hypothetical protein
MDDMNITSAQYIQDVANNNISIQATIDGQALSVPLDPANRHYQAILEWAEIEGNTIQDAD